MPLTLDQFTAVEQRLRDAFAAGSRLDLSSAPDGPERTVRAEAIAVLLRGAQAEAGGQRAGVNLCGARVTGALNLSYTHVAVPLWLEECQLDTAPDLTGAVVRQIRLSGCELPGFEGRMLRTTGDVDLRRTVVRGRVNLIRANIVGELRLTGAYIINPDEWGLSAGGLVVESAVFGSLLGSTDQPLRIDGGIRLAGARLLGGLFFDGVEIRRPGEVAFSGSNMHVFGRMLCGNGFRAEGQFELTHATVDGELSFAGGTLVNDGVVLSLNDSVVDDLDLRTATPITGTVDLRHARCRVLRDAPAAWPTSIAVDGFSFEALDTTAEGLAVGPRLRWLRRDQGGYRPQPYEQLAALYRRLGADGDAHRVLLAKQREQRRLQALPNRVFGYLLDVTVGYGYRPWRAAGWLVVMLAIGTAVFTRYPPATVQVGRAFDPLVYSFDLMLPISAFGLRDAFAPVGGSRWLAYALTAAGWLLATALVAGITRALRRD